MNARRVLLSSLMLNAALGVLAWQLARVDVPVARTASSSPLPVRVRRLPTEPLVSPRTPVAAPVQVVPGAENAMPAFHWSQIESDDYERYVANLRAIGCPEQTLRDIIFADVDELYSPQFRAALRPVWENYWDILAGGADNHPTFKTADERMDELKVEREELLERLLGTSDRDASPLNPPVSGIAVTLADVLSAERKGQLDAIAARYEALIDSIGEKGKALVQRTAELRKQSDAEQLASLTPAERAEWDLRQSQVVSRRDFMRSVLTVEEQREVAAIQAGAGEANAGSESVRLRIRGVIGEERFADYERSDESEYRALVHVGRRLELPTASVIQADDIRRAAQNRISVLTEGESELSAADKVAVRAAILRETSQALRSTLGEKGLKAYQRNGGQWLDQLAKP